MPLASFQAVEKNGPAVYFEGVEVKDLRTDQAPGIHPGGGTRRRRPAAAVSGLPGTAGAARAAPADEASAPRWALDCDGGSRSGSPAGGVGRPTTRHRDPSLFAEMESRRPASVIRMRQPQRLQSSNCDGARAPDSGVGKDKASHHCVMRVIDFVACLRIQQSFTVLGGRLKTWQQADNPSSCYSIDVRLRFVRY